MRAHHPITTLLPIRSLAGGFMLAGALALVGCASAPAAAEGAAEEEDSTAEDDARKVVVLERKIDVAELELEAVVARQRDDLAAARLDLELAEAELATFREYDRSTRQGMAALDLRSTTDRAREASDELAQIEAMYNDQDLDDVTKEFVISRGRRNAERAAERIALQERELARLVDRSLPAEEAKLSLAVNRARAGLADAERNNVVERRNKELALDDLRFELAQLQKKQAAKP